MSSSSSRSGSSGSASTSASDAEYLKCTSTLCSSTPLDVWLTLNNPRHPSLALQSQSINREKAIANILGEPENFIYDEKLKRWVLGEVSDII